MKKFIPVALPPGRARLATQARADGIFPNAKNNRDVSRLEPMGLREALLDIPLERRLSYDQETATLVGSDATVQMSGTIRGRIAGRGPQQFRLAKKGIYALTRISAHDLPNGNFWADVYDKNERKVLILLARQSE
jgi:hypothetical protein